MPNISTNLNPYVFPLLLVFPTNCEAACLHNVSTYISECIDLYNSLLPPTHDLVVCICVHVSCSVA